jgi:hypothetical protein
MIVSRMAVRFLGHLGIFLGHFLSHTRMEASKLESVGGLEE